MIKFNLSANIEVDEQGTPEQVQAKVLELFDRLKRAVNAQFTADSTAPACPAGGSQCAPVQAQPASTTPIKPAARAQPSVQAAPAASGSGRKASVNQVKAVYGAGKSAGKTRDEILAAVRDLGVEAPEDLSSGAASKLIERFSKEAEARKQPAGTF